VCLQVEAIELKPGGKDIAVTEENKEEYVQLLTGKPTCLDIVGYV